MKEGISGLIKAHDMVLEGIREQQKEDISRLQWFQYQL